MEHYLKILELEPDNNAAQSGKDKIFQHFLQSAETLIKEQRFDEADRALLKADITEPDSREVKLARLRLDEAKANAKRIAMEEERKRQEEERKRLEEEQKIKAEEEKRLTELEKQRQEEEQKRLAEEKRIEEEKKRKEEMKLAKLEQQRQEEEAKKRAEEEKKEKYNLLIGEAKQAINDKDKELAISKYNEVLTHAPGDPVANSGIKEAEKLKHKVCYEVLGTWRTPGAVMDIKEDGTYEATGVANSTWKCTDPKNRTIEIQIPLATMTAVLSGDGQCLNASTWASSAVFSRPGHVCEVDQSKEPKEPSTQQTPF